MRTPTTADFAAIERLLELSNLPTDDLSDLDLSWFRIEVDKGSLLAVGGLERLGHVALLRSVATAPAARGRGLARAVVAELEILARAHGIAELYLLTDTAADYFSALGYEPCAREEAPAAIRATRQFSSLCPDSASLLCKRLRAE